MYKASNGKCYYKVGLHIHTNLSDGAVSPEQMAKIYREAGFDAVAITDHWVYHPQGEIGGLKIISGSFAGRQKFSQYCLRSMGFTKLKSMLSFSFLNM